MYDFLKITDVDLKNKRVLIRDDLNTPLKKGEISSEARIEAALPSIKLALESNAAVMIMSHLGRPTEGEFEEKFSLAPVAKKLSDALNREVPLIRHWIDGVKIKPGQIVLFENTRFNVGEKENDDKLAQKMAALCDVYVNDAFATAHRKEVSTYGVAKYAPVACAGILMSRELDALSQVMKNPKRPLVAIIGGAKVSTKLALLNSIAQMVDYLIVGGGIANTFLAAAGHPVGKSLYEDDLLDKAEQLATMAEALGVHIPLPTDVVVATSLSPKAEAYIQPVDQVDDDEKILDIGPDTCEAFGEIVRKARTILWNGPLGAFEIDQFSKGTEYLARLIAESSAYSVAGGGDTIAAIEKYGLAEKISYISTGGGAFLTYLEGATLPAVAALEARFEK